MRKLLEEEPTEEVIPPDPEELEEQVAGEVWLFHAHDMCRFISQYTHYIHILACMHIVAYIYIYINHDTYYVYICIYLVTYLCYEDLSRLTLSVDDSCLAVEQLLSLNPTPYFADLYRLRHSLVSIQISV